MENTHTDDLDYPYARQAGPQAYPGPDRHYNLAHIVRWQERNHLWPSDYMDGGTGAGPRRPIPHPRKGPPRFRLMKTRLACVVAEREWRGVGVYLVVKTLTPAEAEEQALEVIVSSFPRLEFAGRSPTNLRLLVARRSNLRLQNRLASQSPLHETTLDYPLRTASKPGYQCLMNLPRQ